MINTKHIIIHTKLIIILSFLFYGIEGKTQCLRLNPGSIGSNQTICYNASPAAFTNVTSASGGSGSFAYQWQSTTVSGCGSGWGNISGATASTYQAGNLTQTTCYRREVTSSPCGTGYSNTITVTVYPNLTAGSVGSNQSICYNSSPAAFTQTAAPSGGTGSYSYQWQQQPGCSGGWSNISGATATTYNYTGNLTQTTCYRRNVTSGSCGTVSSGTITVTVYPNLTAGSVGSSQSICYNTSPAAFTQTAAPTGGTGSYTYQWQSTTVSGCGSGWGNISGATASTYNFTGNLTQTTCYRRNVSSGSCGTVSSGAITVTVYPNLTAGSVGSNQSICYNTSPAAFTQLSAPTGGTGSYTYQWQYTTVGGCGSGWSNVSGATASTYQAGNLTQTTCFRRNVTSGSCGTVSSGALTVTVYDLPVADAGSDTTFNISDSLQIGSSPIGGYTYLWSPSAGLSNANIANPWVKPLVNTTYYLTVTNSYGCMSNDSIKISILGSSCDISLSITADTVFNPDTLTFADTVIWLSFIADTTYIQILISKASTFQTSSLSLYSGNCNTLSLIKEYSDTLEIYSNSLSIGYPYFIKFSKPNFDTVSFGLSVMKNRISLPYPIFTCTPSTCPNLVLNSEFDTTWVQSLINPPDCPYFETDYEYYYLPPLIPPQIHINKSIGITAIGNDLNGTWLYGGGYNWGNFLAFDMFSADSTSPMDKAIWRQEIQNITPNKTYYFSFYAKSLNIHAFNPCSLGVRLNGTAQILDYWQNQPCTSDVVPIPSSGEGYNEWVQVCGTWTNTNYTSVIFEIFGRETSLTAANEDGGIDHIEFRQLEPNISISASQTLICDPPTNITLNASGGLTYQWSSTPSGFTSSLQNPTATPLVTTTYTVTITRDCNTETASVVVYVSNIPTVDAGTDTTICVGQSHQIGGSPSASGGTSPYYYYWNVNPSGTGYLSNFLVPNPIAIPTVSTTYTLIVTDLDGIGCSASDAVVITVNPNPVVAQIANISVCPGSPINIGNFVSTPSGATFAWTNSNTAIGLAASGTGNITSWNAPANSTGYDITGTVSVTPTLNGCTGTPMTFTVTIHPTPIANAGQDVTICVGSNTTLNASGGTTYTWSPTSSLSNPNLANPIASPTVTTTYTVTVTDDNGCSATDDVVVTVNPLPPASAGTNTTICFGTNTTLDGSGGTAYEWAPSGNLSNSIVANPIATPTITTTYSVTVTDANNCSATDEVVITVNAANWPYHPDNPIGIYREQGTDVAVDNDGYVYAVGNFDEEITFTNTFTSTNNSNDIYVVKYDPCGNVIWDMQIGGDGDDKANSIIVDNNGDIIITGYFSNDVDFGYGTKSSLGEWDLFVVKYDSDGDPVWWDYTYDENGDFDQGHDVAVDANNHVYVVGTVYASDFDIFLAKLNAASGNEEWQTSFNNGTYDYGHGIAYSSNLDQIIITGQIDNTRTYIGKYNPANGNAIVSPINGVYPVPGNTTSGRRLITYYDANATENIAFIAGSIDYGLGYNKDILLLPANINGTPSYSIAVTLYELGVDFATDLVYDPAGFIFVTGQFTDDVNFNVFPACCTIQGGYDNFVAKYDIDNQVFNWATSSRGTSTETSVGIAMNNVGFGYVTGEFFGTSILGQATLTSHGSSDAFIARLHDLISEGVYESPTDPTTTPTSSIAIVNEMLLYPSPAYDYLNIAVKLKEAEHAKIELFDIYGNKINEIECTTFDDRVFTINVSHLAKGTYIVRLSSNNFTTSQKFLIIN